MDGAPLFAFDNTYARLPERFFARQEPEAWPSPTLLRLNAPLARLMGLDPEALAAPEGVDALAGARLDPSSEPIAMAYAGHQFGGFSPQLGDGRAVLLGELVGPDGVRRDVQLKGAGRTVWSRGGDGRAAVGPVLREYVVAEAMAALGVPTTRALAAVATGEAVHRDTPLPGAVLARVATSHVRVGTFQYFAARGDDDGVRVLADYVIDRHYPELADAPDKHLQLLRAVIDRQTALVAQWMGLGFIHGVMNTDNMSVVGETIDYGPCAFMDAYDPATVFSSIDQFGRYAYQNQPPIAGWNLARFAEALLAVLGETRDAQIAAAQAAIDAVGPTYAAHRRAVFGAKLGISAPEARDDALIDGFLAVLAAAGADMTNSFRALSLGRAAETLGQTDGFAAWEAQWRERSGGPSEAMRRANPAIIPRNHRVEAALSAAERGDLAPFEALTDALADPYADRAEDDPLTLPPRPNEVVRATFCGT